MIIRTVTMDDLNEVVELESDAFKMTKKQTEQDLSLIHISEPTRP